MPKTCTKITFEKLGARIVVEGQRVEHYAVRVDPVEKEVSCWIASEVGKKFSVHWLQSHLEYPSRGDLYLDGQLGLSGLSIDKFGDLGFGKARVSSTSSRPFLLASSIVTDDDIMFLESSSSSTIGEIKFAIYRTTPPVLDTKPPVYPAVPEPQKVHESLKKGIVHQVSYGTEVSVSPSKKYRAKKLQRLVTFIFKYRPLEILQENGIAPRNSNLAVEPQDRISEPLSPSEPPSPSERSLGKQTASQVKEESESEGESEDDEDEKREEALLDEIQRNLNEIQEYQTKAQEWQTKIQECQADIQRCLAEIQQIKNTRRLKDDG